jgi:hypothetical protein
VVGLGGEGEREGEGDEGGEGERRGEEEGRGEEGGGGAVGEGGREKIKILSEVDVESGVYTLSDIVLPLPGKSVVPFFILHFPPSTLCCRCPG